MCRIFHDALPSLPLWTSFPHPMYPTLNGLVDRLNHFGHDYVDIKAADMSIGLKIYYIPQHFGPDAVTITKINPDGTYNVTGLNNVPLAKLNQKVIHILPSLLFIDDGVHVIEDEDQPEVYGNVNMVNIKIPISIIGESREHCIVMGGLLMEGKEEYDVNVSNLTLRDSNDCGVYACKGASMHLDNVSVENSKGSGVVVRGTKRNTMKNCNVSHSKHDGLAMVRDGLMTIDGKGTTIHHNCTDGDSDTYGLSTCGFSFSSIHLVSPLTIETISKNNGGGGNYGGYTYGGQGTIAIVDNEGTIIETIQEATEDDPEDDSEDNSQDDSEDDLEGDY
jgi:hypothetical protein